MMAFSGKHSPETIEKMRGRKHSPEAIEKMRGRKHSPETIEKMRLAKLGKSPLAALTEVERADYDLLVKKGGMRRGAALKSIGRSDLIGRET